MSTNENTTIFDLVQTALEGWRLFCSVLGGAAVLTLIVVFASPRYYEGTVTLSFNKPISELPQGLAADLAGGGGLLGTLAGLGGGSQEVEEAKVILFSFSFFQSFVNKHELMPYLYEEEWDSENQKWKDEGGEEVPSLADAYILYKDNMLTVVDLNNNILEVSIFWTDPKLAALWANRLVSHLDADLRSRSVRVHQQNISYLRDKLENETNEHLLGVAAGLLTDQMSKLMLAENNSGYLMKILDPAVVAEIPSRPRRLFIALGGALFGVILSFSAIFFRRNFLLWKKESE